jgi:nitrogenase molybdenum-iron protein alpha/beta subunit
MPECENPLWPCAMTGAAACLAGFEGITVVIHGSSGCYYYPATLLHAPLQGTFILDNDVIFGSEQRLHEVLDGLGGGGKKIAVVMTCVPAILGEDIRSMLRDYDIILVDSPGFSGDVETGYKKALSALGPCIDPDVPGINIDGACLFDPFSGGNVREIIRLLGNASVPVGTIFCSDRLEKVRHAAAYTVGTNRDFASGVGEWVGGTLGFDEIKSTLARIASIFPDADPAPVFEEIEREDERIIQACDKFLRRFDPPRTVIFAGFSYAKFTASTLKHYLDADIRYIGSRNEPEVTSSHIGHVQGFSRVKELIRCFKPDLIIGSSFEQSADPEQAFVGLTPPLRGVVKLAPHPVAGISGSLSFVENVLNACMDHRK